MSNPPSALIEKIEEIEEKLKTSKEILKVLEVDQVEEDLTNCLEKFSRKLDKITATALFNNREKLLNGSKDVMQKMIRSCPDSMKYINKREQLRFEFLLSLDRSLLMSGMHNDMPFAHATILHDTQNGDLFKMYFEKTFRYCKCYYGGMLFIKNKDDVTAFDVALQKYGKTNLMRMLKGLVPNGSDFRIIHYFAFFAPEYVNMIYKYFREQAKGKDHNGRTLKQLILAGGMSNINYNFYFLDDITKQELYTRDPVTGLFPFAATAVGEDSDVEYSYVLLRKNPKVIDNILLRI